MNSRNKRSGTQPSFGIPDPSKYNITQQGHFNETGSFRHGRSSQAYGTDKGHLNNVQKPPYLQAFGSNTDRPYETLIPYSSQTIPYQMIQPQFATNRFFHGPSPVVTLKPSRQSANASEYSQQPKDTGKQRLPKNMFTSHKDSIMEKPSGHLNDEHTEVFLVPEKGEIMILPENNDKGSNFTDMLSELDDLYASVITKPYSEIYPKSAERARLTYDRKTLMDLRSSPLTRIEPPGLRDIPEIIQDQTTVSPKYRYTDYRQPKEDYFINNRGTFPIKQQKKNREIPERVQYVQEHDLEKEESKASDTIECVTATDDFYCDALEVPGKNKLSEPDNEVKLSCDLCQTDGEDERAQYYCSECNEFLCQNCAKAHRKSRASKHHSVVGEDDMPKGKSTSFRDLSCEKHINRPLEYFCLSHQQGCCTLCITEEHRQCKVEYIDVIVIKYEESEEYKRCMMDTDEVERQLQEKIKTYCDSTEKVRQRFDKVLSGITSFRMDINRKLDDLERKIVTEMHKIRDRETERLDKISAKCRSMMDELAKLKADLDDKEQYKQRKQLFLSTKVVQTKIMEYTKTMQSISEELTVQAYSFQRNEHLAKTLMSVEHLGSIYIKLDEAKQRNERYYGTTEVRSNEAIAWFSGFDLWKD